MTHGGQKRLDLSLRDCCIVSFPRQRFKSASKNLILDDVEDVGRGNTTAFCCGQRIIWGRDMATNACSRHATPLFSSTLLLGGVDFDTHPPQNCIFRLMGTGTLHKMHFRGWGGVLSTAVNCSFSAFKIQHMLGFRNDFVSMRTQNRGTRVPSFGGRLHCTAELCITNSRKNGRPDGHEVQFFRPSKLDTCSDFDELWAACPHGPGKYSFQLSRTGFTAR